MSRLMREHGRVNATQRGGECPYARARFDPSNVEAPNGDVSYYRIVLRRGSRRIADLMSATKYVLQLYIVNCRSRFWLDLEIISDGLSGRQANWACII